ncbi:MAG: PQQ-binding-like beta-propeller repeat protein, partial [bacterium]
GPPNVWTFDQLGKGFGTVSTQGERLLVQGTRSEESVLFCIDRDDGQLVWASSLGKSLQHGRGDGPRGTPSIDNSHVYALSENGDLAALKIRDGSFIWRRNILEDFGGKNPNWLMSESPLIDGARLVVMPGGKDASVVALDKMTGETLWKSEGLSDRAGYSSCIVADVDGSHLIMAFTSKAAVGLRASDGLVMWRYEPVANKTANVATPIFHKNKVFYSSAYGTGAALLELKSEGDRITAKEVYFTREMQNHHGGVLLVDGYLYGFSGSILTCLEFETGKRMWRDRSVGKGSLTFADGHLYLVGEDHKVGLAVATPEGYVERGRFSIEDYGKPSWAHPVVSGGHLYIRNLGTLTCYDVSVP